MKNTVIAGIGSNINPEENISKLLEILKKEQVVIDVSSFIRTSPVGITVQPDFINGAVKMQTIVTRNDFNVYLKTVEDRLKRDRSQPKYGPRTIDLDIVVWNGEIVDDDYYERDFLKAVVDEIM